MQAARASRAEEHGLTEEVGRQTTVVRSYEGTGGAASGRSGSSGAGGRGRPVLH